MRKLGAVLAFRPAFALILAVVVLPSLAHSETIYFPKGSEGWYSQHLTAMQEPSLFQNSTNQVIEQYRFLWLRTFHKPIAVRIWKDGTGISLRVVRLSGKGGYDPGKIEYDTTTILTDEQWKKFLGLLQKSAFWDMPSKKVDEAGYDGAQWVLEGQASGKYHVVDRWSPSDGNRHLENYVACCRYLLSLAKQEIPKNEDY